MIKTKNIMKNLNLKKLFICAFVLLSAVTVFAQTTCSTIAEIKAQPDGTAIVFQGEAMTTYHQGELSGISYGVNGILMQDATGAILLNNAAFKISGTMYNDSTRPGYCANFGGTKVSKIIGTFRKATSSLPDRIEFSTSELKKIETGKYGNEILYKDVNLSDFLASPADYELLSIAIDTDAIVKEGSKMYFRLGDKQVEVKPYFTVANSSFPKGAVYYGFCESYKGNYRFSIEARKYILPSSFSNIVDMYNFTDDSNSSILSNCEVEITEPVLVNYAETENSKINYYVQSSYLKQTKGFVFSVDKNSNITFKAGDSIVGLKGHYNKYKLDNGVSVPTTFVVKDTDLSEIKVVNEKNSLTFRETKITTIKGDISKHEGQLVALPRGEIKKVSDKYFFCTQKSGSSNYDSIRVVINDATDLSRFVDVEAVIGGVFSLKLGVPTIMLRSSKDIITDDIVFESIGEMIASGTPIVADVVYELSNPVLVTYKYANEDKGLYGLYLQDSTGAILCKTNGNVANVNLGDSIVGVKGIFHLGNRQYEVGHYLNVEDVTSIKVLNNNNEAQPMVVTLSQIINDPIAYASHLVKVENIETITRFGVSQGTPYETNVIYQEGASMTVVWPSMYDEMEVVGVVEYGVMGQRLTIFPIDVKDITKEFNGTCRRIVDIKKLASGTEFTYVGDATTTFTDYENGILIQDYTGGILLKNAKLGDKGDANIKSGMLITNIKGKYYPASGDILSCVEISDVDIANIVVKEEGVDFEYKNSDVNSLKLFYDKYLEGEALVFVAANITGSASSGYVITFSYYEGSDEKIITLPAIAKGYVDITKFELVGYARKFNGVLTFVIVGDQDSDKVDIENEFMIRDVFISSNGELSAPEAIQLMVYDINGRILVVNESSQLNLSFLNRGVYLVRSIYADGTTQITKIIR